MHGKLAAHITTFAPYEKPHLVRLFDLPAGQIDDETGQPMKEYVSAFLIVTTGQSGEIQAAMNLPRTAVAGLRTLGRALELKTLWWRRWVFDKSADKYVKLEPAILPL